MYNAQKGIETLAELNSQPRQGDTHDPASRQCVHHTKYPAPSWYIGRAKCGCLTVLR